jgi:hypothetical protein
METARLQSDHETENSKGCLFFLYLITALRMLILHAGFEYQIATVDLNNALSLACPRLLLEYLSGLFPSKRLVQAPIPLP